MSNKIDTQWLGVNFFNYNDARNPNYRRIKCGNCGITVSAWLHSSYNHGSSQEPYIPRVEFLLCTNCGQGTVIDTLGQQHPGSKEGEEILGLPDDINELYEEIRSCFSVSAFTAAEILCRKVLMNIGCDKGAPEGKGFDFYIDYIEGKGYITNLMKDWVGSIRKYPNDATHKVEPSPKERALDTFRFTVELLKLVYEIEYRRGLHSSSSSPL